MSKLSILSGKEVCKKLREINYEIDHQTGSHIILRNNFYPYRRITVSNHKEIAKGTLKAIIKQTGLTVEEFKNL